MPLVPMGSEDGGGDDEEAAEEAEMLPVPVLAVQQWVIDELRNTVQARLAQSHSAHSLSHSHEEGRGGCRWGRMSPFFLHVGRVLRWGARVV